MKDLTNEIMAYSLLNAIEHGSAKAESVMPKLFQHGLAKSEIKEVMPLIKQAVDKVNSMSAEERKNEFVNYESFVMKKTEEKKEFADLPGIEGKKKLVFRAAPFPSGALHIGNAKTYLINAIYAERYNADLILVMDDTIGSSEKPPLKEGYTLIEEAFDLLGVKFKKPTVYKSDRLHIYYDYAEKLIELDKAYVCHCAAEELRDNRARGIECGCRQFPVEMQLKRWKEIFKAEEGSAVLRIKTDMQHPNPAFRDRVLFKISDRAHPRVGKKYRVWPTLEMSWAIDDHLLGITHIIRGNDLVIETMMEKYIWDIFSWEHPETIHTGLIQIEGTGAKVSKSKSQKQVMSGEFIGWHDPRTWSIQSLIARGIRRDAIREFIKEIGINRQDVTVPIETLYSINRKLIDAEANRYSFIPSPVEIEINDMKGIGEVEVPLHPDKPEMKKIKVGNKLFVSRKDFDEHKGKEVRLLHLFNIKMSEKAEVTSVENKKIPRINWVSNGLPVRVLMLDGTYTRGVAEEGIVNLKKDEMVQFERFGFCRYASESEEGYDFWFGHQ